MADIDICNDHRRFRNVYVIEGKRFKIVFFDPYHKLVLQPVFAEPPLKIFPEFAISILSGDLSFYVSDFNQLISSGIVEVEQEL